VVLPVGRKDGASGASSLGGRVDGRVTGSAVGSVVGSFVGSFTERVVERARALRFDVVGIASATAPLVEEYDRYESYLASGFQGTMDWLAENREVRRRVDTADMLQGARSVICLARSYRRDEDGEAGGLVPGIARYARGRDYHTVVRKKLRQLAAFVRTLGDDVQARPLTDDAPILERAWAARAGLGFVGKNGLLIVPGQGSYVLLGEVLTTLQLDPGEPIAQRCGSCTRCLEACPTDAFAAPFVLDARRCIAYTSIEHEGTIDAELSDRTGPWLFGCDVCQAVCPFNAGKHGAGLATDSFRPHDRWRELSPVDLLETSELDAGSLLEGTPLARAGVRGLARNAAIVLGNAGFAPGSRAHHALVRLAAESPHEELREHAARALVRGLRRPEP